MICVGVLCFLAFPALGTASAQAGATCAGVPVDLDLADPGVELDRLGQVIVPVGIDVVRGTPGDDIIIGGTLVCGLEGDDRIFVNSGAAVVFAGRGDDVVAAKGATFQNLAFSIFPNIIYGGAGDDTISGGYNNDQIFGGTGNDVLRGQRGNDTIRGGPGNDAIRGNWGSNRLFGNSGRDTIIGGLGDDFILGGLGVDTINGFHGDGDRCSPAIRRVNCEFPAP